MHDNSITITTKILNSSTIAEEFIISRIFNLALTQYYPELHQCKTRSSTSYKKLFWCLWHLLEYRDNLAKLKPPKQEDNQILNIHIIGNTLLFISDKKQFSIRIQCELHPSNIFSRMPKFFFNQESHFCSIAFKCSPGEMTMIRFCTNYIMQLLEILAKGMLYQNASKCLVYYRNAFQQELRNISNCSVLKQNSIRTKIREL